MARRHTASTSTLLLNGDLGQSGCLDLVDADARTVFDAQNIGGLRRGGYGSRSGESGGDTGDAG